MHQVNAHTLSPIREAAASEAGALDGFHSTCSCGLVLRSSLRTILEQDRVAHSNWHIKSGHTRYVTR